MVTYKSNTQKGAEFSYTTEDLNKALDDIRNGKKMTQGASIFYNIPCSMLKHHIRGTHGTGLTSREGHSYMPHDRDYGIIEKRKRCCKPMVPDKVPADVVRNARLNNPFIVVKMNNTDFGQLANKFISRNKLQITKLSWITFDNKQM